MGIIRASDLGYLEQIVKLGLSSHHPRAWSRFYHFITLAHQYRKGWDAHWIQRCLMEHGISREQAEMFSYVYWHGRCVLQAHRHFRQSSFDYVGCEKVRRT